MTPLIIVVAVETAAGYEIYAVQPVRCPKLDLESFVGQSYSSKAAVEAAFISFVEESLPGRPRWLKSSDVVVVCFDWPIPEPDFAAILKKARVFSIFPEAGKSSDRDS